MNVTKNTAMSVGVGSFGEEKFVIVAMTVDDTMATQYLDPERAKQYASSLIKFARVIDGKPRARTLKIERTFVGWMAGSAIARMHNGSTSERIYKNPGILECPVSLWYKGSEPKGEGTGIEECLAKSFSRAQRLEDTMRDAAKICRVAADHCNVSEGHVDVLQRVANMLSNALDSLEMEKAR